MHGTKNVVRISASMGGSTSGSIRFVRCHNYHFRVAARACKNLHLLMLAFWIFSPDEDERP